MTYVEAAAAPLRKTGQIKLHGKDAFEGMRKAGRLVAECLDMLVEHVKPGVTTEALDKLALEFGFDHGALPATLMYRGYKKASCTSINHVVCHGIPGDKPMKEGDIVNIDVTLILNGWHGDSSRMYAVGNIPRRAERLIDVTYDAMMRGIAVIRSGATTGDIGNAIQTFVEAQHMSVVRDFCGHGLGRLFHDEPNIVHVGRPGEGIVLRPGMFFTVEPMINLGRPHVKVLSDGWTAVTRDRSLSAQFEHTIGVTATGCDVKPLAKALIAKFGSFAEVVSAPRPRLREIEGLGEAAIAEIKIVQAAASRLARGEVKKRTVLSSWSAVLDYCRTTMAFADKEQFRVLFLDKRNQVIADEVQQTGTVDHTPVYPREVMKRALELSATALILVHNHPSGDPTPSRADIQMTQAIIDVAKPLGIAVHDHIIVGKEGHASFKGLRLI